MYTIPAQGIWKDRPVWFCTASTPNVCVLFFPPHDGMDSFTVRFSDREKLEQYFVLARGGELK
jgi:hypothetical protein